MEKKDRKPLIVIIGLAILVFFTFLLTDTKEFHNWKESYRYDDKEPYGGYLIYSLLEKYFPHQQTTVSRASISTWLLDNEQTKNANYVFIGDYVSFDSLDANRLAEFVKNGNTALIACKYIPASLLSHLFNESCLKVVQQTLDTSLVSMNFVNASLKSPSNYTYSFKVRNERLDYEWTYLTNLDCEKALFPVGYLNDGYANFLRFPYGKGYFYFHTNPIVFTNFHMKEKAGLEYAQRAFSYLNPGKIYWDESSKLQNIGGDPRQSPLRYILSKPSLQWAWYMTLMLIFLYLLFQARRKQRPMPVIPQKINTSIEFTETIGRLYLQQEDHKKIADQIMKLFLSFNRNHYRIATSEDEEKVMKNISIKSGVHPDSVNGIFNLYKKISYTYPISNELLVRFYREIEAFHQKRK